MPVMTDQDFEIEAFARELTNDVIPALLRAKDGPTAEVRLMAFTKNEPNDHAEALLAAARSFTPPEELAGRDTAHAVLLGAVALRAATPQFMETYPDMHRRYEAATSWVCVNLGTLIWWDCDN